MSLIQSKQVSKFLQAPIFLSAFTFAAGSTTSITAALTTAAATAGDGGVSVPVQVASATQEGFITSGNNTVQVWDNATGQRLADAKGNEVYGRLTGAYTLSLYSKIAGVETAYTYAGGNIDLEVPYKFTFEHYPSDAAVGLDVRYVGNDPAGAGSMKAELLIVTATNTLSAVSTAPNTAKEIVLIVNGQDMSSLASPAPFTVAGTAVTWSSVNAGYSLATTDSVVIHYYV
jgi:hypothetical protein